MAMLRPINLGARQTTIGGATSIDPRVAALLQAQTKTGDATPADAALPGRDNEYAVAQALSQTPRVEGYNPLEAVAAALTGGLRGRLALREHDDEQKQQDRQNQWADVLQQHQLDEFKQGAQDRARTEAQQTARTNALQTIPEELRPYALLGIEGPITQYFRHIYPTPQRGRAGGAAPELPGGFQWEN